jgi:DNA-binding MarR family transcriptional regulator
MTSVKGVSRRSAPVPPVGSTPVPALTGELMKRIRDAFATEDWEGLRQSHFRLMSQVPREGISVTDLAVLIGMTKQGCGQFVAQLTGSGHLEIGDDPDDRRVRLVFRTAAGDRTMKAVEARILRIERDWAHRVGRDRYAVFRDVLEEIAGLD